MLSGLWHGAAWTFVIWGALNGLYVVVETIFGYNKKKPDSSGWKTGLGFVYVIVLASFANIFFRAGSLKLAVEMVGRLFGRATPWRISGEFEERTLFLYGLFGILLVMAADIKQAFYSRLPLLINSHRVSVRLASCIVLAVIILLLGVFDAGQFIYFQF